ncbi:hypothetical protein [Metabacillus fastidiosus]|uniref:hypothetical protein n=1 Tax=Metabacillus fastidiosus TaxID=1458 RepID=UPI002DBF7594|nr:hypothetical protein [Metabacillus fastidiosus]MEC2077201.1 hypothetical protein [Metabacillus fastidiosus]
MNRIYDEYGNYLPFIFWKYETIQSFIDSLKAELTEGIQSIFQGSSIIENSHKKENSLTK